MDVSSEVDTSQAHPQACALGTELIVSSVTSVAGLVVSEVHASSRMSSVTARASGEIPSLAERIMLWIHPPYVFRAIS